MRVSFPSLVGALLVLSYATCASAQAGIPNVFTTNLSLGFRGAQVIALQTILNRDPDTRIPGTGPGSQGYETNYFGPLTKTAVIRFQEKYAGEVLAPAGLAQGNGFVGFFTRIKLNALSVPATSNGSANSISVTPIAVSPAISPASTTVPQNPNLQNLDKFLTVIDKVGTNQGLSITALAAIHKQVVRDLATTTDLRAAFLEMIQNKPSHATLKNSLLDKVLATVADTFDAFFAPEHARAATGAPFGGALLDAFYCTQSQTWLITLEPLPPSYVALLTYVPFSQAFLSYNIPTTNWLLGEYAPGAGVCVAGACPYCVSIPSEGMISPVVGSSPSPVPL